MALLVLTGQLFISLIFVQIFSPIFLLISFLIYVLGNKKSKIRNLQVSYFQSYPYFTRLFLTLVFVVLSAAVGVAVQAFDPSTCEIEVGRQAEL